MAEGPLPKVEAEVHLLILFYVLSADLLLKPRMKKAVISAPGKVILFGEHAVVHGKLAVAISVGLRTTVNLEASEGDSVNVSLPSIGLKNSWTLEELTQLNIQPGGS